MSVSDLEGFHWRRRVEFAETDMAGIAHFSSFIIYMEQAEHALLRSLGTSVFGAPASLDAALGETQPERRPARIAGSLSSAGTPSPTGNPLSFPSSHRVAADRNVSVLTWPRVHCECDYLAPARFEDELDIFVTVSRLGTKSVSYLHRMFLGGHEIATGKIVAVCSMVDPELGVLTGIRIPEHLRELLSEYLAQPK
jgi:acyl-CoA thioesterase FadM